MTAVSTTRFTEAEYLALESASETKHEFVHGAIAPMAGARPPHNVLAANVIIALGAPLRGTDCVAMTSDQRVHVPSTGLYAYPDATVACGERRYTDGNPPSLLNPTLLFEVTSDSTEDYDRGSKFIHYQAIPSLREYVVVSHREPRIDHHRRLDSGQWLATTYTGADSTIALPSLGGGLRLEDIYAKVDLHEGKSVPPRADMC